jgi:hypothetical protein
VNLGFVHDWLVLPAGAALLVMFAALANIRWLVSLPVKEYRRAQEEEKRREEERYWSELAENEAAQAKERAAQAQQLANDMEKRLYDDEDRRRKEALRWRRRRALERLEKRLGESEASSKD